MITHNGKTIISVYGIESAPPVVIHRSPVEVVFQS